MVILRAKMYIYVFSNYEEFRECAEKFAGFSIFKNVKNQWFKPWKILCLRK